MATESILLDALRIPARYADEVLEAMESKKKVKKLEEEYNEISVRVVALETFLRSDDWFKMDKKEKELVDKQKEYSTKYADILRERMSFYKDKIF